MRRSKLSESDGRSAAALFEEETPPTAGARVPDARQHVSAGGLITGRVWLVAATLLLIVAAPLLRPGLPATQAGLLPVAHLAGASLPPALTAGAGEALLLAAGRLMVPLLGALAAYKLLLAGALVVGAAGMGLMGRQVGGTAGALLATALFLFLPLLDAALYLDGRVGWAWAWALWPWALALTTGRPSPTLGGLGGVGTSVRWGGALALAGLALAVGGVGRAGHVAPAELLVARWPDSSTVAAWLSLPVHQLGQAALALALLSAWLTATTKAPGRREVLTPLLLAAGLVLSALVPGLSGLDLRLLLAALFLLRAATALPALALDFARGPWLAATVALVAVMGSAHLAPAFHDRVPTAEPRAVFGPDRLVLLEATVEGTLAPGGTITVTTTWQVAARLDQDYTAFVHVVGPDSPVPVAQQDGLLLADERASSQWVVGEVVVQRYSISVPTDAPGGPYRVLTGLYRADTGERLPRWPEGDSVEVAP